MAWRRDLRAVIRGLQQLTVAVTTDGQIGARRIWANASLRELLQPVTENIEIRISNAIIAQKKPSDGVIDDVTITSDTAESDSKTVAPDESNSRNNIDADASRIAEDGLTRGAVRPIKAVDDNVQPSGSEALFAVSAAPGSGSPLTVAPPGASAFRAASYSTAVDVAAASFEPERGETVAVERPPPAAATATGHNLDTSHKSPTQQIILNTLSDKSRERKVPGSRIGRLASFGSLAAGLGMGALAEVTRRSLGITNSKQTGDKKALLGSSPFLTEANAQRIVATLCRVRGAALKLGQMLSIQDSSLLGPELQEIFERVRQSADFMPAWQMERVISGELGADWKSLLASFDEKPFAAASIGQVHRAVLLDGREVAMKIQYPGVSNSIDSDINNLMSVLKVWKILPDGMYIQHTMESARNELKLECDYIREAKASERFRSLLKGDAVFYVPEVIADLTTKEVLTSELVSGVTLDRLVTADQQTRNWVCLNVLGLCLDELFLYQFMQTDPNWSNFLYDDETKRINLIDFGASRCYSRRFTDDYLAVIKSASDEDREGVLEGSKRLGFLTGYESKVMKTAHIDSVMIIGKPFKRNEPFDFGSQGIASEIHSLIPIMLKHRLTPPPEEVYSLHRKLAGCFLLCTKLNAVINVRPMFEKVYNRYTFGLEDDDPVL